MSHKTPFCLRSASFDMRFPFSVNRCAATTARWQKVIYSCMYLGWFGMGVPMVAHANESVEFNKDVMPVLQKYCVSCHTAEEAQGGLVMETFDALLKGGDSGPAITPGVPSSSRLILMSSGKLEPKMPPDDAEGPNESELALLATWIEQGAKGPAGEVVMRRELQTPAIAANASVVLPVTAVAVTPNGTRRAVARYQNVSITDGGSSGESTKLEPQPGKVNSLRFSQDGKRLLVGSGVTGLYGRAAIHDVATGKAVATVEGHADSIQVAVFSPDEKLIATAGYDREIIVWEVESGKPIQTLRGHNGAIHSLAFSRDGKVLVSASADATVKVWEVATGKRLDTMSQPQQEVLSLAITADDSWVIAGSADNRLRVWQLLSRSDARINPLVATRFVDETPLTHLALTSDGTRLVVVSEAGNVKVLRTDDWSQIAVLEPLGEIASDLSLSTDGSTAFISLMNGQVTTRELPRDASLSPESTTASQELEPVYLDLEALKTFDEAALRKEQALTDSTLSDRPVQLPRGAEVTGSIANSGEEDWYSFSAREGELWVIETETAGMNSRLDSLVEIYDSEKKPVLQTRLQATRDSYFTFRGKNSTQHDDFRVFAWEEMKLDEYFYASGEVTKLWMHPRGADSGFLVYPGRGNRWTYFGSSGTVHALGEPAYIVRPLAPNEPAADNGLPVFDFYYSNDDHPMQNRGKDSYLLFKAPAKGQYLVRARDTRGEGGGNYAYRLRVRPASPSFKANVDAIKQPLKRGSGRELALVVERLDGYEGEVLFELDELPPGIHSNFPVRVQPGQSFAIGNIWADADAADWEGELAPAITARAKVNGRIIERPAGIAGKLKITDRPKATIGIYPADGTEPNKDWVIQIRRGETISLIVKADRLEGFTSQISLGNEQSGRNMPHGVYVDNIGLNGLLVREGESERQFFVTASPIAELGQRSFFLTGAIEGGITTRAVTLEVTP